MWYDERKETPKKRTGRKGKDRGMENQLFRKESLDHVASPEQVRDYLRVTGPKKWMAILAVLALAAGFGLFALLANQSAGLKAQADVFENMVMITLPITERDSVSPGMKIRINGKTTVIKYIFQSEIGLNLVGDVKMEDGTYEAEILKDTESPMQILLR